MSERVAWEFISLLSNEPMASVTQPEQSRLRTKQAELAASPDPASLIRSWLPRRARLVRYAIAAADVPALLNAPRLVPSGLSDTRSGLSAGGDAEGYVHDDDEAGIVADHLLSHHGRANVWLHLSNCHLPRPVPFGALLADLADHDGPREDSQVLSLLHPAPS